MHRKGVHYFHSHVTGLRIPTARTLKTYQRRLPNSICAEWSQVEGKPKNACSVVEMNMLGEGHMLGSRGKRKKKEEEEEKCLNSAQKNSICSSTSLRANKTDTAASCEKGCSTTRRWDVTRKSL